MPILSDAELAAIVPEWPDNIAAPDQEWRPKICTYVICGWCEGQGEVNGVQCEVCAGSKRIEVNEDAASPK